MLAVGDGALGFWAALREVFPEAREQRCWFHKIANVLKTLPKSAQPTTKTALAEIWSAENRDRAERAAKSFITDYGVKWPKNGHEDRRGPRCAAGVLQLPRRALDSPQDDQPDRVHVSHVRLCQRITKGPGSRAAGIAKACKLIESAQTRLHAVNAPHPVALVRAGARFNNGVLVERPTTTTTSPSATIQEVTLKPHDTPIHRS